MLARDRQVAERPDGKMAEVARVYYLGEKTGLLRSEGKRQVCDTVGVPRVREVARTGVDSHMPLRRRGGSSVAHWGICGPAIPWLRRGRAVAAETRDALRRSQSGFRRGVRESRARSFDHISQRGRSVPVGSSRRESRAQSIRSGPLGGCSESSARSSAAGPGFVGRESSRFLWQETLEKPDNEINTADRTGRPQ